MTASNFNAITYANKLIKAGLDRKIADVHAEELGDLINKDLTTKTDLKDLEQRLIIRLGGMLFVCAGLVVSTIKLMS